MGWRTASDRPAASSAIILSSSSMPWSAIAAQERWYGGPAQPRSFERREKSIRTHKKKQLVSSRRVPRIPSQSRTVETGWRSKQLEKQSSPACMPCASCNRRLTRVRARQHVLPPPDAPVAGRRGLRRPLAGTLRHHRACQRAIPGSAPCPCTLGAARGCVGVTPDKSPDRTTSAPSTRMRRSR